MNLFLYEVMSLRDFSDLLGQDKQGILYYDVSLSLVTIRSSGFLGYSSKQKLALVGSEVTDWFSKFK
jgi:hypothetical protein